MQIAIKRVYFAFGNMPATSYDQSLKSMPLIGRLCRYCGTRYDARRWYQIFCSREHRVKHYQATHVLVPKENVPMQTTTNQ